MRLLLSSRLNPLLLNRLHDACDAGGSIPDSDLTASQLRARHGVAGNSRDFSTRKQDGDDEGLFV